METSKIMEKLISTCQKTGSNSLHFMPEETHVKIHYYKNTLLLQTTSLEVLYFEKVLRYLMFKSTLSTKLKNYNYRSSLPIYNEDNEKVNIMFTVTPLVISSLLVIKILPNEITTNFEDISDNVAFLNALYADIRVKKGIYFFTGENDNGKIATISTILEKLVVEKSHVRTIESPITIVSDNFTQMQVNEEIGIGYTIAVRNAARDNPDILFIDNIENFEVLYEVIKLIDNGTTVISQTSNVEELENFVARIKENNIHTTATMVIEDKNGKLNFK